MNYKIGDIVMSVAGHDKGFYYVVLEVDGEFVLVANGKTRLIDKPKRKKAKHVIYKGSIDKSSAENLLQRVNEFSSAAKTGDSSLVKCLKALGYNNSKIMIER